MVALLTLMTVLAWHNLSVTHKILTISNILAEILIFVYAS